MKTALEKFKNLNKDFLFLLIGFVFLGFFLTIVYLSIRLQSVQNAYLETTEKNTYLHTELDAQDLELDELTVKNSEVSALLSEEQKKTLELEEEKRNQEEQIDELTKLTTIDPELLKKYSKVYFLSENYTPRELEEVEEKYKYNKDKKIEVLSDIIPYLERMLDSALEDGVDIRIGSAYRSFETQKNLKDAYTVTYGASTANKFSAEQGYSEHQLGTTLDFTTPSINGSLSGFDKTDAYKWLTENAYKYGFVISYPKSNGYYIYEPWHWRFVGKDLSRHLHREEKYFYELDQREIDEYLLEIFD